MPLLSHADPDRYLSQPEGLPFHIGLVSECDGRSHLGPGVGRADRYPGFVGSICLEIQASIHFQLGKHADSKAEAESTF